MPHRHVILRRSLVSVAVLLVLALVAAVVTVVVVTRRPLPAAGGEVTIPELSESVRVVRNAQGVPDIYAATAEDLFQAQGYVQAQDRFFEMDYRRHVTAGRLAELVGDNPDAIEADKVIRTFGWRQVAEAEWKILDAPTKSYLTAYADGVNAYLEGRSPGDIAFEYTVLGLQVDVVDPEPWSPIDSLAWLKAMAWDLRGNYDDELGRVQAFASIRDVARVNELFPAYPQDLNAPILDADQGGANLAANPAPAPSAEPGAEPGEVDASSVATLYDPEDAGLALAVDSAARAVDAVPVLVGDGEGIGSNSWVVSGALTDTGAPLLANDPHLSLGVPSIWSQVGLHCLETTAACPFDVSGFSFAGFPGVIIGHNASLAWGITNLGADVTDFFLERTEGSTYEVDGSWVELDTRTETIKVNGGEDIEIEVRSTEHGPIISDVLDVEETSATPVEGADGELLRRTSYAVSLAWTALTPGLTAQAIFAMDTSTSADDIKVAAEYFEVPSQNIIFATVDGHIGYQAPGRIPVREEIAGPVPSDGTWPRPGWDSRYDWQGWVDPAAMPSVLDPASGFIVAANQAVAPAGSGPFLSRDWDYGYRSNRIQDLLQAEIDAGRPITVDAMAQIQNDTFNPYAEMLVPTLMEQTIPSSFDRAGQDLFVGWDYSQDADSAPAAYFAAVWVELLSLTFDDELSDASAPDGGSRWLEVVRTHLDDPTSPWWDDRRTVNVVETRDEIFTQALVKAREQLTKKLGREADEWQWGKLHRLALKHPVLGGESVPGVVRGFVNPSPVDMGGGSSIVNATSWDASSGSYDVTSGPSMRMVVDLADLDRSTWVVVTGASGHPASGHYADQLDEWAAGETFTWQFSEAGVSGAGKDTLTLTP